MTIAEIVELLKAIASILWPIAFLLIIVIFKSEIGELLFRIKKGKFAGQEIELADPTPENKIQKSSIQTLPAVWKFLKCNPTNLSLEIPILFFSFLSSISYLLYYVAKYFGLIAPSLSALGLFFLIAIPISLYCEIFFSSFNSEWKPIRYFASIQSLISFGLIGIIGFMSDSKTEIFFKNDPFRIYILYLLKIWLYSFPLILFLWIIFLRISVAIEKDEQRFDKNGNKKV